VLDKVQVLKKSTKIPPLKEEKNIPSEGEINRRKVARSGSYPRAKSLCKFLFGQLTLKSFNSYQVSGIDLS
jgi:hypothetical protein